MGPSAANMEPSVLGGCPPPPVGRLMPGQVYLPALADRHGAKPSCRRVPARSLLRKLGCTARGQHEPESRASGSLVPTGFHPVPALETHYGGSGLRLTLR